MTTAQANQANQANQADTTPDATPKKWTTNAGPIQTKRVEKALGEVRWAAKQIVEIGGIKGRPETEHRARIVRMFAPPANPKGAELLNQIGERHKWTIERGNYKAIIADLEKALQEVKATSPLEDLRQDPEDVDRQAKAAQEAAKVREVEEEKANAQLRAIMAKRPPNATALIVAEEVRDKSDAMTDYAGHETGRVVAIGWRTGQREDFRQLRRAAANFPETAHLGPGLDVYTLRLVWDHDSTDPQGVAKSWLTLGPQDWYVKGRTVTPCPYSQMGIEGHNLPEFTTRADAEDFTKAHPALAGTEWQIESRSVEHRDNWSMGGGNYLAAGYGQHSSGWHVKSKPIGGNGLPLYMYGTVEDALPIPGQPSGTEGGTVAADVQTDKAHIEKHYHTKRQEDFWLVVLADRVDRPEFEQLRAAAKALGGWYSRKWGKTPGGFGFGSEGLAGRFIAEQFGTGPDPDPTGTNDPADRTDEQETGQEGPTTEPGQGAGACPAPVAEQDASEALPVSYTSKVLPWTIERDLTEKGVQDETEGKTGVEIHYRGTHLGTYIDNEAEYGGPRAVQIVAGLNALEEGQPSEHFADLWAVCHRLAAFQFSDVEQKQGYHKALGQLCLLKRQARKALGVAERGQA